MKLDILIYILLANDRIIEVEDEMSHIFQCYYDTTSLEHFYLQH